MKKRIFSGTAGAGFSCLLLGALGCASTPTSPIPAGKPAAVEFYQPPKKSQPKAIHLRLINRSWVKGARPQVPSTKICADEKMEKLLLALDQLGFFRAARAGRGTEGELGWIQVTGPEGSWVLERPRPLGPEGRLPGEDFRSAFKRYQQCCGAMLLLYNATFDLVPREVKDGRDFFLQERKRVMEQRKKILEKAGAGTLHGEGR